MGGAASGRAVVCSVEDEGTGEGGVEGSSACQVRRRRRRRSFILTPNPSP